MASLIKTVGALSVALSAWLAPQAIGAVPPEAQPVAFYVDGDLDYFNSEQMAQILVRNGAPVLMVKVPFGRATHLLREPAPGCSLTLSRELPGREAFHWLAETFHADLLIATSDPARLAPSQGDLVASYSSPILLDALTQRGYQPLMYHTDVQAVRLLETDRTKFIAIFEPGLDNLRQKLGKQLEPVARLRPLEVWLGCNPATSPETAHLIAQAWEAGLASGEIIAAYEAAHALHFMPGAK